MVCENCEKEFLVELGTSKRFCSMFCSRAYSNKFDNKTETKSCVCIDCKTTFNVNKRANAKTSRCEKCKNLHLSPSKLKRKELCKPKVIKERKVLFCLCCGKETGITKYCDLQCKKELYRKLKYDYFLSNPKELQVASYIPRVLFYNIFLKEQQGLCDICGCGTIHNEKPLVFVCDHIDGDATHNTRDNLRLICSNCDSQLPTFKSKNKNSTRSDLRKKQLISKILKDIK